MSYQVLARKWRPRNFGEMVGQEHVLRALVNALDHDRLHHAFLFTGTRGVGKTTIARILAKSLNCEAGVSSSPCGRCSSCCEIDEGRFVDLIEVDAASRTKVEDTRELLENVQYAPSRGRYKVYLIDEVHMLSDHSFNALLKTLEEPPPHVKFLLATTDPQKLPITILSRCLQFSLKRLPIRLIADHLTEIMRREEIAADAPALQEIARAADGSMRDALSLLDQAIAHGGGRVVDQDVRDMLGTIERGQVFDLLHALAASDGQAVLEVVETLAQQAPDFEAVLAELTSVLHRVAVAQAVPGAVDDSLGDADAVRKLADLVGAEDLQLFYQIALIGRRDLPLAPDPRSGLEMVLLRMLAFRPSAMPGPALTSAVEQNAARNSAVATPAASPSRTPSARPAPVEAKHPAPLSSPAPAAAPLSETSDEWGGIVAALGLRAAARELAVNCALVSRDDKRIVLALDPVHEQLAGNNVRQRLEQALQQHFNAPIKLDITITKPDAETPATRRARLQDERHQAAVQSIEDDAVVKNLRDVFNAEVRPDLIQPVD